MESHMRQRSMPAVVQCSRCPRKFPPNGQVAGGHPILLVLTDVVEVDVALTSAFCHWCAKIEEKPVYSLLKFLGEHGVGKASSPSSVQKGSASVVVPRATCHGPSLSAITVVRARTPVRPPRHQQSPRPQEGPKLPPVLRPREIPPRPPKVTHLTGGLGSRSMAALRKAGAVAKGRDQEKRDQRAVEFEKKMLYLYLLLCRIRKNAASKEVWSLVDSFREKLGDAARLDIEQRGKQKLMQLLKTSTDDLEALCLMVYQTMTVEPDGFVARTRFIRTKSKLPVPNLPLESGDNGHLPKVIYPAGTEFGPDYSVENGRSNHPCEELFISCAKSFMRWLTDNHSAFGITVQTASIDITPLLETFFAWSNLAEQTALLDTDREEVIESGGLVIASLDTPATT